jgi:PadR family transcriptional regulator, regulatory protein PadR
MVEIGKIFGPRNLIYHNMMYIRSMYSKELLKGTISAIILKLLSEQEKMYGYEISQKVKVLSQGKILLKDGSLYPALQKMTSDGLLSFKEETVGGRVRKYYYITQQGRKETVAYVKELKDFISTLNRIVFPEFKAL